MRTAEVETVRYRTEEIQCATMDLVVGYAKYSGIDGTVLMPNVALALNKVITNQLSDKVTWATPGLTLKFSGFPPPLQRVEDEKLMISASSPFFTLEEGFEQDLSPALKNYRDSVTNALIDDLRFKHRLEIERVDPLVILRFPKEIYAKEIEISKAVIL